MWTTAFFPPFLLSQLWIENERKSAATTTAGEIESGRSREEWWAEKERKGSSIIQSPTVGQKNREEEAESPLRRSPTSPIQFSHRRR